MNNDLITRIQNQVRSEQKEQDGVSQIALGFFILLTILLVLREKSSLFVIFIPFIPVITEGLRRRFTYPRVGRAILKVNSPQRIILIFIVFMMLVLGIAGLLVSKAISRGDVIRTDYAAWAITAIGILLVAAVIYRAWADQNWRILVYALFVMLLAAAIIIRHPRRITVEYIILGFGVLNIMYGIMSLSVFAKKYPVVRDEQ